MWPIKEKVAAVDLPERLEGYQGNFCRKKALAEDLCFWNLGNRLR